jgi:predicted metal-binding protein
MGRMPRDRSLERWIGRARELGAQGARIVGPRDVFCAEWVRLKCQYGCDGFGSSLTCPPHTPTPERTRRIVDEYSRLLLVHCKRWADVHGIVVPLEREIFLDGHHKAFAWSAGPCRLCRTCDTSGTCRHAERARPAMEACGIDVYATARKAGFPIRVVRSRRDDDNYFGLVAIE